MSNQRVKIKDLKPRDEVKQVFNIKYLNLMTGKDGRKYLNVIFTDSSGDLEGRVWSGAENIVKQFNTGDYVEVEGKVNQYQGRKQLVANRIESVDKKEVNEADFIKKSDKNTESMFQDLLKVVDSLDDFYIQSLLTSILSDQEIARRFKTWQAGKTIHHAYQSGLLEHVLSCSQLGLTLAKHYKVNYNFVVAGAILHDMCKIYELTSGVNTDYTEEGKLVGHLVKGVELIDRFCNRIKNFPFNTRLHLKHIVVSHHGKYEYGSPKLPSTREAALVHYIDHMDSKMGSFEQVIKTDQSPGHWSGFVKHLDRIVFKADLPHYSEELKEEDLVKSRNLSFSKKTKNKKSDKELKQNLGSLLKDFEVK